MSNVKDFADVMDKAWIFVPPIIFVFGTIGNILTVIVMKRKAFR